MVQDGGKVGEEQGGVGEMTGEDWKGGNERHWMRGRGECGWVVEVFGKKKIGERMVAL